MEVVWGIYNLGNNSKSTCHTEKEKKVEGDVNEGCILISKGKG